MLTDTEHDEDGRLIPWLIAGVACWCARRPWLVLIATVASCAVALHLNLNCLEYQTQRNDLLSQKKECFRRWQKFVNEFGDDDDMVVVVQGKDRPRMEQALEAVAGEIRQQPDLFDRLFYKVDLRQLRDRALLFLPEDQIREIQANVAKMDPLINPPLVARIDPLFGWSSLTLQQLLDQADKRLGELKPGEALSRGDEQFFQQLDAICRGAAGCLDDPSRYHNPWLSILPAPKPPQGLPEQEDLMAAPQYLFCGDNNLAFVLVRPIKEKQNDNFTAAAKNVEGLRDIIARVAPSFPDLRFGLTGLPVLETDEMIATQNDTKVASWLALAGVAVLFLIVYRGFRYPLMTVTTLLVGIAWSLGWTTLTVGHLNILSAAFAVMLIGMGDYGVLWVTRFDQERRAGADLVTAVRITASSVGPGTLTAAITTALAFFATTLADFKAIAELGWIAGSGVLMCALSCFTVLPALLALFHFRFEKGVARPGVLPLQPARADDAVWLPWVARRPGLVLGASLAVTVVLGFFAARVRYDHNLLNLQAQELESVKWEHVLINHTAGANWYAVSYTDTPQEALALKAKFEQLPVVSRVVEVASLVPPGQESKVPLLEDIQRRLKPLPPRGVALRHALPNVDRIQATLATTRSRLEARMVLMHAPVPENVRGLAGGLKMLEDRLVAVESASAARQLREFEDRMARDLADDLHRLRDVSSPRPITVADMPECLRERYIGKTGKWLLQVFGKECLWDFRPLLHFVKQIQSVDPEAAGKPFTTVEGLLAMKNGFLWAGLYALAAMAVVLFMDFRNWRHTLVTLAPLAMGIIVSLGFMTLCGLPLNPANMIAFPLLLGVGVNYGVHVLHDHRWRGVGRRYLLGYAMGQGIMVTALTAVIGFGTLLISTHRGLASLGLILTLGIACCMLTALTFLPALLHLQSIRRQPAQEPTRTPAPPPAQQRRAA